MGTSPQRADGRTLIEIDPEQLVWILSARESKDVDGEAEQVENQIADLREFTGGIGGRVDREIPENDVSAFKRKRVQLPDGTYGYRVVRPAWESIMTALRRGEANALAVPDIDRATRDPRTLEDLIDVVELYGVYVVSLTGNIDLTTDEGISRARDLVNQRNQESRNTSRRTTKGKRKAALKGKNPGGPMRPFGWRKDRTTTNKREAKHIRRELPRIKSGVSPLTIAKEWNERKIPTVTGVPWRAATVQNMFLRPRMCGKVVYRGTVLKDTEGEFVRGQWEPILTDEEHDAVVAAWGPREKPSPSRLGARGRGYRTIYLLSPFVRCGKCNARMVGGTRRDPRTKEPVEFYRCPSKGAGGCGCVARVAAPIHDYIKALVIAEQHKIEFRKVEELPPWPKEQELKELQDRIDESTHRYEAGKVINKERHFSSLARMEASEAVLKREKRAYEAQQESRKTAVANLDRRWDEPDFTMEQKQAAIAKTLSAVVIAPAGKGVRFHPDQIDPIFRD